MWREYKQGFHSCGKSAVYLSERTGSRREGTPVPGSLTWAKARFFRGYDGVFKPSKRCNFCASTSEKTLKQNRDLLRGFQIKYNLTSSMSQAKEACHRFRSETRLAARVLAGMCVVLLMDWTSCFKE